MAISKDEHALNSCFFQADQQKEEYKQSDGKVNAVVMGRKTWESLPAKYRPLPGRMNIVLSKEDSKVEGTDMHGDMVQVFNDFEDALTKLSNNPKVNEVFVVGGQTIYDLALNSYADYCKLIVMTRINKAFEVDTYMPTMKKGVFTQPLYISKTYSHQDITYDYCFLGNNKLIKEKGASEMIPTRLFEKYPKHAEMQYLEIIKDIIDNGQDKEDRTGVGI